MSKRNSLTIIVTIVMFLVSVDVYAGSSGDFWPTWRGPDRTGAAKKGNPPVNWSETENIKWKVEVLGESISSPIIWENKIFYLTAIKTSESAEAGSQQDSAGGGRRSLSQPPSGVYKFDIVCMDRSNGNTLWQKTAREELPHQGHHATSSFASYSPVTDGKLIWAGFGSHGVYCYDMDGNQKWSRDLGKMDILMGFGEGGSVALAGDAVIAVMDHQGDSIIYALNKETGDIIWKKGRDEVTSWATPLAVEVNGRIQVVTCATGLIRSYDVENGDIIWQCSGLTRNVIPSPVTGFGMLFCTSGFRGSSLLAIELGRTGDLSGTDAIKWQLNEGTPYVPSPLLFGDKIYVLSVNKPVVSCYQARTGKPVFVQQQLEGMGDVYASPVGVDDRIYFIDRKGVAKVIKNSDRLDILATNKLDDGFDASPAIVGDELYLKGRKNFYCVATQ
jgi:outer membrane protein assembly factor BamB